MATQSKRIDKDVKDVVVHAGGRSPGVAGPSPREARSPWFALLKKGASVAAGMVGLAAIGLVAGAPKSDRLELMSVVPGLGDDWLAGSEETASIDEPPSQRDARANAQGKPADVSVRSGSAGPDNPTPLAGIAKERDGTAAQGVEQGGTATENTVAEGAEEGESDGAGGGATAPKQSGVTADGKVILNIADASELERLPGVGNKRALKILELREKLGRFKKPTELLRIKGIGPKSLNKMLPHLVLDPPEPPQEQGGGAG